MKLVFVVAASFMFGCATTHIRIADKVEEKTADIEKILVLTPEIDAKVKYISVPKFYRKEQTTKRVTKQAIHGYVTSLKEKGYQTYTEKNIYPTSLYKGYSTKIKKDLRLMGENVIRDDLEYNREVMSQKFIKKVKDPFPEEWKKYDAVVFLYGDAKVETDKEFCVRWRGNIIYNILAMPLSITTLIFPFLLPVAFIGSGEYSFDKSPDETYLNMVVVDTHSREIIYQYDYFISQWGFSENEFHDITYDALDEFPQKE